MKTPDSTIRPPHLLPIEKCFDFPGPDGPIHIILDDEFKFMDKLHHYLAHGTFDEKGSLSIKVPPSVKL